MKKILIILFLIFISFSSNGEWVKTGINYAGDTDYFDINRVQKIDGYLYYWILIDYPKLSEWGDMSVIIHMKGDCDLNRVKYLSYIYSKEPMGKGRKELSSPSKPDWKYLSLSGGAGYQLDLICKLFK